MKFLKLEKIYFFLIILIFTASYVLYSFGKPPLYTLTEGPGDAFYYLVYGREAADFKFFSWNGLYPSNGFHPLWLIFVSLSFFISQNLTVVIMLLSVFLFIFFIISLSYFNKITQIYDDKLIQVISTFIFTLFSSKIFFWYMESALTVVLFLIYIYYVTFRFSTDISKDLVNPFIIGIISSLIALSRLDMVLLIFPLHGFLILSSLAKKNIKNVMTLALPPILIVGIYVLLIFLITGAPVPLSGVVKSTFPDIFRDTEWAQLLTKQTKYGIIAVALTLIFSIGSHILIKLAKKDSTPFNQKNYLNFIYLLLLGSFLHLAYHISFTGTGGIGRWYFVIHLNISILAISLFLYNLKKFLQDISLFSFLSHKTLRYIVVIVTLPLIFYASIYSRAGINYKKTEAYAAMKFAEILEKKNFDKSLKIYDGTDGSFAYFTKIPTLHVKGMAATPDYVFEIKKNFNQFCGFRENFLIEKKVDYVLLGKKIEKGSKEEDRIKNISDFNMLENNENFIISYYLIKTKNFFLNDDYDC